VIAAAGRGKRFAGERPKVLADVGGQPCLARVTAAAEAGLGPQRQLIVVSHRADEIRAALGDAPHRTWIVQHEPRGTGDALQAALERVPDQDGELYFLCGDKPLLRARTLAALRARFLAADAALLFLTGRLDGPAQTVRDSRQGRVVTAARDGRRLALAIVERQVIDAHPAGLTFALPSGAPVALARDELLDLRDVNVSTYAWRLAALRPLAACLRADADQGEVLVTDLVALGARAGLTIESMPLADPREGLGIDTVEQWHALRDGWGDPL
jgi:bifunctional UDP-N-acetylglucosamine pyrophosphorylase/glucosamine-1-phosphate N-acetyltransferase